MPSRTVAHCHAQRQAHNAWHTSAALSYMHQGTVTEAHASLMFVQEMRSALCHRQLGPMVLYHLHLPPSSS